MDFPLAQRPDWNEICKIPLGIIPGGSGNALNCSILRQLGQPLDGLNNLGASWSGYNAAIGADENKSIPLGGFLIFNHLNRLV